VKRVIGSGELREGEAAFCFRTWGLKRGRKKAKNIFILIWKSKKRC
jgi:hypothetical protein